MLLGCSFLQNEGPPKARKYLENGGRTWARTKDPLIKSQLLCQLSYASVSAGGAMPLGKGSLSDFCCAAKP